MKHFIAVVIFLQFLNARAIGQLLNFDPNIPIDNVSFARWTAEDGLSSNNLTHVFQDSRGLLWITSFNGVMLFDGQRIEVFDVNNLDILDTDGFYTVVENDEGVIFIGSQGSGLIQYEEGKFSNAALVSGELPKSIPSLFFASDGSLYLGSNNHGLYKLKDKQATLLNIEELSNSTISNIKEDQLGRIWVATEGQGLFGLVNDKLEFSYTKENGLYDDYIESLAYAQDEILYIATTKGLQYLSDDLKIQSVKDLDNVYINYLYVDDRNAIWAGTENGLVRWVQSNSQLDWIYGMRGVDLVRLSAITKDHENSIWLTSSRSGLIRVKQSQLSNWTKPDLSSDRINIIHESWDGNFYVGTDQNQIDVYSDGNFSTINISTELSGNGIRDIYHDTDGSFWMATYVGIIHKKGNQEQLYSTKNGMPANNFRVVYKDTQGDIYFGTRSGGLIRFKNNEIVEVLNQDNKLESNFILCITPTSDGSLFIGTHSGGMTRLLPDGSSQTFHLKSDDSGILLFNIDMLDDSTAIVTSNIGLLYFDGQKLSPIELMADHRSKTYFDLVEDRQGNFWISTNLGILRVDGSDWTSYLNKEIETLPYSILDENNGMNNEECTGATRSILTSKNKVLVPTLGGVCEIHPNEIQNKSIPPEVLIRNVFIDDEPINISNHNVEIEPGALRYVFEFAVVSYIAPERNQYSYILEGFEKKWSEVSYSGRVEYTNLPPDTYTFKVIGANDTNNWNKNPQTFTFTVKPFFYQTFWFYLLIFMLMLGAFALIYSWRVTFMNKQNVELKKLNSELDRFVYSASHEIRSPLSSILGLINLARMGDGDKKMEYIDLIEKSVKRLDEFIYDIVDYSRNARLGIEVSEVDFETMITNILTDISHTNNYELIKSEVNLNHNAPFYSDEKRLKVILSNIITNAIKHHEPKRVENPFVKIQTENSTPFLTIKVIDNGPGISKEDQKNIFKMFYRATTRSEGSGLGLYIVSETLEKLQGKIEIDSEPGRGSEITITLRNLEVLIEK